MFPAYTVEFSEAETALRQIRELSIMHQVHQLNVDVKVIIRL